MLEQLKKADIKIIIKIPSKFGLPKDIFTQIHSERGLEIRQD